SYRSCDSVYFLDARHGWAGCSHVVYPSAGGQVITGETYSTTDGGSTWTEVAALDLTAIRFLTTTTGVALTATAGPYHTIDGGQTWQLEPVTGGLRGTPVAAGSSLSFADAVHGWASGGVGGSVVIATSDGGATWHAQPLPGTVSGLSAVAAVSPTAAVAVAGNFGTGTAVVSTTDGGATWVNHSDPIWLSRIYQDALGRPADPGGLDAWLRLIDGGANMWVVATDFTVTSESRGVQVDALYRQLLQRPSDAGGRQSFINNVAAGATYEQVTAQILASTEYSQHHGSTNTGWLSGVYSGILGRTIDSGALSYWNGQLARRSRVSVARSIVTSAEGLQRRLSGMYVQYLHRGAGQDELAFWSDQIQHGVRDERVVVLMLAQEGYPNSVVAS
ncbi:MAG TPA: DUF4214 domain-containing protein, partial [Candidatus Dormibacteraeota bacterium]|nr:DUF4214 domain-containing protein [Candidatus Dormibacteraeota bacterium]